MTTGIGVFSSKGRAEGVDPAMGKRKYFSLELAADRQPCPASKKILSKRICSVKVLLLKGGDSEHFPCPFAVRGRDNRGLNLKKTTFLKKTVHSKVQLGTDPGNRAQGIGS